MRKSKRRQSSGLLFFQLLFVITLCLFGLVVFVILSESEKQLVTDEQIETLAAITKGNGKEIDEKWIHNLRNMSIAQIVPFHNGLSHKYKAILSSNQQVMIKLAEKIDFFPEIGIFSKLGDFEKLSEYQRNSLQRADRKYQGWPEIASFYLDRVMGFYKKPPITGRIMTNKELYQYDNSIVTKFLHALPTFTIRVAIHAWVTDLINQPPTPIYMKYLTQELRLISNSQRTVERCLEISDNLIFDMLIDDHDRKWDFNWKATSSGINLHWDSGLAWRHGPVSIPSCLNILCGPTSWLENSHQINATNCQRICLFRNETVNFLRKHSPSAAEEDQLVTLWENAMREDPLYPMLEMGLFWDAPLSAFFRSKRKFPEEVFYSGFNYRMGLLLNWIDECTATYGENNVLYSTNK